MSSYFKQSTVRETGNNEVMFTGIDMGAKTTILHKSGPYWVIHVKGHTGWGGVGSTRYYPARYYLMKVEDSRVTDVIHSETAEERNWRDIRKDYVSIAQRIWRDEHK